MKGVAVPEFKREAEERKFRETHDSTDYLDWGQANPMPIAIEMPRILISTLNFHI
ncbi:MAG: hypothetical protein H5U30_12015 [Marinobacter sp.]|nr:hypothetical protein [Marinobacter sp.]